MSKTTGSCMCGAIKYEITGAPDVTALCHCTDCQKWTGGAFTSNIGVKRTNFQLLDPDSHLKSWDVKGNSGKNNKHNFCGQCGSSLFTELEIQPDSMYVKAGGLDDGASSLNGKVDVELYCKDRVKYLGSVEGAKQERMM